MTIHTDLEGHVAIVTIDIPEKRNSLGPAEAEALADAIAEVGSTDIKALVLTGRGAFCAGGDLKTFSEISASHSAGEIEDEIYSRVQRVTRVLRTIPVPTIAAIDGPAVGLGMDIALACDMRFMGPRGSFVQGWSRAGLIPGTGGVALLDAVNPTALWRMLAEQEPVRQQAGEQMGLAECAPDSALASAIERGAAFHTIPGDVLAAYTELSRSIRWPREEHFKKCSQYQSDFLRSSHFRDVAKQLLGG